MNDLDDILRDIVDELLRATQRGDIAPSTSRLVRNAIHQLDLAVDEFIDMRED